MGVRTGVPYWDTEALSWMPEMARPAPAVLNSIPVTNIARMAKRDFMDWFPFREGFAARRRTRCLISSSCIDGGLGPVFFEAPNDVVELGHRTLIRSSTPIPD